MSDSQARMLCIDPGEMTGWSIWCDDKLLGGGQTPLWNFAHDVADVIESNVGPLAEGEADLLRAGVSPSENVGPIKLIVCEIFALYPWKAKELAFDEFRTVQLIGAIKLTAARHEVAYHAQPAQIKERALAGGARELFVKPVTENRHTNDSIQHGFFYRQVEVHGAKL